MNCNQKFIVSNNRLEINSKIYEIYSFSLTNRLLNKILHWLRSILEIRSLSNENLIERSITVENLSLFIKSLSEKISHFFNGSQTRNILKKLNLIITEKPLRFSGFVIIISLVTNLFLVYTFKGLREIQPLGIWFRGIFLLIGIIFLFCGREFNTLKQNSFFYNLLRNKNVN